jgi:cobalamin biosynthesis Mg chelatase CobN
VLAVLALALFPVAAQAACSSSSCATYETEIPSVESKPPTHTSHASQSGGNHNSSNNARAEGSGVKGGSGSSGTGSEPESEGKQSSGGVSSNGGGNNPPTSGGGEAGGNSGQGAGGAGNSQPAGNISGSKELPTAKGENASENSGGSSPFVPILIAVAVLAAISIGVVLYRQRKASQGSDGHPDGHVSSSNAS